MGRYRQGLAGKAALAASATLLAVALPSSVFAVGMLAGDNPLASRIGFTPAAADPDMAELIAQRADGQPQMMRFTPAGAAVSRADRSLTVAVRLDRQTAQSLAAQSLAARTAAPLPEGALGGSTLRVTPTRYNLGIARGYGRFAQSPVAAAEETRLAAGAPTRSAALSRSLSDANLPDLASFNPRSGSGAEQSRFAARVQMDEERPAARQPDARPSVGDQMLDLGGSYRLTRNLDITAGVRYEQDRDIVPLPEVDQQDSQAVYIGTQFRF
ncbi:hypothetical protein GRI62_14405 [Erythrobacter arachoides]|uniref:Porin domain-containing protein n=1 Tax=Aurantiacibacter arachoides TaxID=1850444 RepID=A0A845A538_9SPHN|nr:hypothetical protein [Aurantiacibacter arachoides]MXO94790.1 hypothetical protein [Aurantiacibacter arachoides]GGD60658.1 hypothetical protein GCM10011411_21100 [Aurantiacibacter arachoides]